MSTDNHSPTAEFPSGTPRSSTSGPTTVSSSRLLDPGTVTHETGHSQQATDPQELHTHPAEPHAQGQALPNIPGYLVEGEIARGGMGVVYRATHLQLLRPAAIKMILGGRYQDPTVRVRFFIEAEAIAALDHPNVVHVLEFGTHDHLPFFVLEFVSGGTLSELLQREKLLPSRRAADLLLRITNGVAAAHAKGIVHRDLKPANVLLTDVGEPKITDFGLAKFGDSGVTASGAVMGTPSYMSPEQAAGKTREVGTHSDLYALGAILYELLTGRPPFKGDSVIDTIQQVLTNEPQRPRQINKAISHDLETICLKCLEKEPAKRYSSADALAADLRAYLENRPITARPVGPLERLGKWAKRHPAVTSLALLLLVLILVGIGMGMAYQVRLEKALFDTRELEVLARKRGDEATQAANTAQVKEQEALRQLNIARRNSYAQQIALAESLSLRDPYRALELLNNPDRCPEDLLDFAWRLNYHRCLGSPIPIHTHLGKVIYVAVGPDGRTIYSAGGKTVKASKYASSEGVRTIAEAQSEFFAVALSPNGRWLVTSEPGKKVRIIPTTEGNPVDISGLPVEIKALAFSPDNKHLALGGTDGNVRIWNIDSKQEVKKWKALSVPCLCFAYSSNGNRLAAGGGGDDWLSGGEMKLFDLATDETIIAFQGKFKGDRFFGNVRSVLVTENGQQVVCGSGHEVVHINAITKQIRANPYRASSDITALAISPDGLLLASGTSSGLADMAEQRGHQPLLLSTFPALEPAGYVAGIQGTVTAVGFTPGRRLVVGTDRGQVMMMQSDPRMERRRLLHQEPVASVQFSADDKQLVSYSGESVRIWDIATSSQLGLIAIPPKGRSWVSPDRKVLVVSDEKGLSTQLWDLTNAQKTRDIPGCSQFAFSADHQSIFGVNGTTIHCWNRIDGTLTRTLTAPEKVTSLHYDSTNRWLIAQMPKAISVWRISDYQLLGTIESGIAYDVTLSGNGGLLAFNSTQPNANTRTVQVWDLERMVKILELPFSEYVDSLFFGPDGKSLLVFAGGEYLKKPVTLRVYLLQDGSEILQRQLPVSRVQQLVLSPDKGTLAIGGSSVGLREIVPIILLETSDWSEKAILSGHRRDHYNLAFSPDGKTLASSSLDRTARIWDAASGNELGTLTGFQGTTFDVEFSHDGKTLAVASYDGTIRIWDSLPESTIQSREAGILVDQLFDRVHDRESVIAELNRITSVHPGVRNAAQQIAAERADDPTRLNRVAWYTVERTHSRPLEYMQALRYAEIATRIQPGNGAFLNTLGAAQYRNGKYEIAITTLQKSLVLNTSPQGNPDSADLAFLAMAHHQLGQSDRARDYLEQLLKLPNVKNKKPIMDGEPDLVKETESLLKKPQK